MVPLAPWLHRSWEVLEAWAFVELVHAVPDVFPWRFVRDSFVLEISLPDILHLDSTAKIDPAMIVDKWFAPWFVSSGSLLHGRTYDPKPCARACCMLSNALPYACAIACILCTATELSIGSPFRR